MRSYRVTITDEATILVEADDITRTVYIFHSSDPVYLGGENVSPTNGLPIDEETAIAFVVPRNETIYAVCNDTETSEVSVLTPDPDDFEGGLYAEPEAEPEPEPEPE
jgi:hypothetical protein